VPVVGPRFNFPTANSVADDFSRPQPTNALGQGIGGSVIVANLIGPNCGPQQRTDHLYHRHGIVESSRDRTVRLDGFSTWTNYWPGSPWHSFCLYRPDVAFEAANGDQLSDRAKVTFEEYKSIAQRVIASFGTYSVRMRK
jgi:hypothetical protein